MPGIRGTAPADLLGLCLALGSRERRRSRRPFLCPGIWIVQLSSRDSPIPKLASRCNGTDPSAFNET